MSSNGDQHSQGPQVTIPGIVPRRVHGASPSFGTWLEGHQERLDRQVLLKVIPPRNKEAAAALELEIEGLLHLAGEGVPLVIDEGESAGVPYLIVEDADGVPLSPGSVSSDEDWQLLGELLFSIEERVATLEKLLLPVPFTALRRLPSGGFALLELGWLVPFGETIPDLPQVPERVRLEQARPEHRQRFLAASMTTIGNGLGGAPVGWRQAISLLQRERDVDRDALENALGEAAQSSTRLPWLVAVILLLVVSWSLLQRGSQLLTPNPQKVAREDAGDPVEVPEEGRSGDNSSLNAGEGRPSGGRSDQAQGEREESAWKQLQIALPEATHLELPLLPLVEEQLERLLDDYPDTFAAGRASRALDHQRWARLQEALEKWLPLREVAGAALGGSDLAAAESALLEARNLIPGGFAPGGVAAEMEGLQERIIDEGQQAFLELERDVLEALEERRFIPAAAIISDREFRMPRLQQEHCQDLRELVTAMGERYRGCVEHLQESRDQALAAFANPLGPTSSMSAIDGLEEFPDLQKLHRRWRKHFHDGERFQASLLQAARARLEGGQVALYQPVAGEPIRAAVEEVRSHSLIVRPAGSRVEKELAYSSLTRANLDALLAEGGVEQSDADSGLLLFLLGNPAEALKAIDNGEGQTWREDARWLLRRQHLAERDRLLELGRQKSGRGDLSGARDEALRIAGSTPRDLIIPVERELGLWCREYWQQQGPGEAFPGAKLLWKPEREIDLEWNFSGGASSDCWRGLDADSDVKLKGGILLLRGSHRLESEGLPLPFARRLKVTWRVAYRDSSSPNLNLVLWTSGEQDGGEGLLAGVGFRPQGLAAIAGSDGEVLLPANLLGPLGAVSSGRMEKLAPPRIDPRIPVQTPVDIVVESGPAGSELKVGGKTVIAFEPTPRPHGTVEIRTYDSTLLVASIAISGELAEEEWQLWLADRVERDLYSP